MGGRSIQSGAGGPANPGGDPKLVAAYARLISRQITGSAAGVSVAGPPIRV